MLELNTIEKKILVELYALTEKPQELCVARRTGKPPVVMSIGRRRFESDQAVQALSQLYSRGLLQQRRLNHFVLTTAGRELAKLLRPAGV